MAALARAVAGLLHRGGWFLGLVVVETLVLLAFWWSGGVPGAAFDRRAAEADFLLLTVSSLPALVAGALLASGDQEDGFTDFYRSCRLGPSGQLVGSAAGLFAVAAGALALAYLGSLAVAAPASLARPATFAALGLALGSTLVHGLWGLALGAWLRSRWAAVAAGLVFWVVTVFALEALVQTVAGALGPRWALGVVVGFTVVDPSALFRVASTAARGQWWAYGPAAAPWAPWFLSPVGLASAGLVALAHVAAPGLAAVAGLSRRTR